MIFLTVGTGPDGFDRLVRGVDAVAPELDERVRAQIGRGEYLPEHLDWFRFTSEAAVHDLYRRRGDAADRAVLRDARRRVTPAGGARRAQRRPPTGAGPGTP
jgi:hypothetical protein